MVAQDQALRTNAIKVKIDKQDGDNLQNVQDQRGDYVAHIASECSKLAKLEYKVRHDNVAGAVHWSLCNNSLHNNDTSTQLSWWWTRKM